MVLAQGHLPGVLLPTGHPLPCRRCLNLSAPPPESWAAVLGAGPPGPPGPPGTGPRTFRQETRLELPTLGAGPGLVELLDRFHPVASLPTSLAAGPVAWTPPAPGWPDARVLSNIHTCR